MRVHRHALKVIKSCAVLRPEQSQRLQNAGCAMCNVFYVRIVRFAYGLEPWEADQNSYRVGGTGMSRIDVPGRPGNRPKMRVV